MFGPRVWAEVDLSALADNTRLVRARIGSDVEMVAVVKADAYGHGAGPVSGALMAAGADRLAVGDSTEAIALRDAGITAPIIILGAIVDKEIDEVIFHRITPSVHSLERVKFLDLRARRHGRELGVVVKVDTGLGRLGVRPETAPEVVAEVARAGNLRLEALMTHLADAAADPPDYALEQFGRFLGVVEAIEARGLPRPRLTVANSAAIFAIPETHVDMVRPGAVLYGLDSGNLGRLGVQARPVMAFRTQVVFLKGVPAGTGISYRRTYQTPAPTRIATLSVGYNDGLPFALGNCGEVLVRGRRAPIVGRVTMDYVTVDVGAVPGVRVGDPVTLFGRDGDEVISAEELAARAGTLNLALTCGLGRRVKRLYREGTGPPVTPFRMEA